MKFGIFEDMPIAMKEDQRTSGEEAFYIRN